MRVAVVAEWYPSAADPVHGVWAHRQALAARDAGAEVRVLALRRPVPPLATLRAALAGPPDLRPLRAWAGAVRPSLQPFELDGLTVQPVPFLAPPRPWSYGVWGSFAAPSLARALTRLAESWPFDVVHAHNVVPTGDAAVLAHSDGVAGRPVLVVSAHGPDIIHGPSRSRAARRAVERTLASAELVVANSRWAETRCEEIAGAPVPSRVVHLGTDVPLRESVRHERPTLVTVAHLQARKRHAVVLHALSALPASLAPDYVIVGDGPGRAPLERLAHELGLGERVRFLGQLDHAQAVREAWRCHLFVMPSVEEPFGVAYVEAMAGGLPAIGARGEGGPEDIAAAGGGMELVPADDHLALAMTLERILGEPERLAALGAAARRTVEDHFTWARCGAATVAAYRAAFGSHR